MRLVVVAGMFALAAAMWMSACTMASPGEKPQDHAAFVEALQNRSTAPSFVKFQVAGPGQSPWTQCTTANFLLGAIHLENGLPYNEQGLSVSMEAATSNMQHVFRFTKPEALANLPPRPTEEEMQQAAALFAGQSDATIRKSLMGQEVLGFYRDSPRNQERMSAVACALIDLGYKPRRADIFSAVILPVDASDK